MTSLKNYLGNLLNPQWPSIDFVEIRKRARLLVVDDCDFPYIVLFRKDGYTIDKWNDVDDLSKMESGYFDLILLDIQNVGKKHSAEQGFGILKHIHQVNPAQIIIAYSNADWSLKYQEFFSLADASLAKTDDYFEFKRIVDCLLVRRFSIDFYLDRVCKISSLSNAEESALRKYTAKAILRRSPSILERYLGKIADNKETIALALRTVGSAIALYASLSR